MASLSGSCARIDARAARRGRRCDVTGAPTWATPRSSASGPRRSVRAPPCSRVDGRALAEVGDDDRRRRRRPGGDLLAASSAPDARLVVLRELAPGRRCRSFSESAGIASSSRKPRPSAVAESTGRRIRRVRPARPELGLRHAALGAVLRRVTLRTSAPVTLTTRPRSSARWPSSAISAGSSVTAPRIAIADDDDRADRHRAHDGRVDQEQAGERDDHGHAGEDDGDAGGAHRDVERLVAVAPALSISSR